MSVLIGKKAPYFQADALYNGNELINDFSLDQYLHKNYVVFYFFPSAFSELCSQEVLAFEELKQELAERQAVVVGCSTNPVHIHQAWAKTTAEENGISGLTHTLVADHAKTIAYNYGVLAGSYDLNEKDELIFYGEPVSYRGLFLLDKTGIVRHQLINDIPYKRNTEEILRVLDQMIAHAYEEDHSHLLNGNGRR